MTSKEGKQGIRVTAASSGPQIAKHDRSQAATIGALERSSQPRYWPSFTAQTQRVLLGGASFSQPGMSGGRKVLPPTSRTANLSHCYDRSEYERRYPAATPVETEQERAKERIGRGEQGREE